MLELRRIEAAFNLMVAAASRQGASDNNSGSQTNVFHGPVNVVQGPGSYSVAQLNLNADAKDKLVSALDAIASALSQQDAATLPFDADEVRELAIEGKTELEKPRPNSGKVRAFIAAVGSAIIEAPRLKASYDTLNGPPRSPASRFPRCAK